MDTSNYFYHTGIESQCKDKLLNIIEGDWDHDKVSFVSAKPVMLSLLDDYLLDLQQRFNGVALLIKLPAHSFYAWHTDRRRLCCMNLELNDTGSTTYFGKRTDKDLPGRDIYDDLVKLPYDGKYVLLNTTEYHSVANIGEARILFSLGFNNTRYQEVLAYLNAK